MYGILAAGYGDWPIISQVAWLLGNIMNAIYNVMDSVFNVQNIGVCIIIFTIVVYTLMIPLTLKQQKWSKMSSVMNPEIQKIQKKYANKKDQASMLKQQDEMNAVYEKYGTSPTGGCLPMLINMVFLFALYPVIQNIPRYVDRVRAVYTPIVDQIMASKGYQPILEKIGEARPILMAPSSYDYTQADTLVNVLYKFQDATWETLVDQIPSLEGIVNNTMSAISHMNNFLGINIGETPVNMFTDAFHTFSIGGMILAAIIPVMAGLTQFISVKLQPQAAPADPNNQMANSMKTMTYTMPLFSVFLGFTLPAGLGLYWAISAAVRCIQQLAINKYLNTKTTEQLIEENRKKAKKKIEKKGTSGEEISKMAKVNTKSIKSNKPSISEEEIEEKRQKAIEYTKTAKSGSLASKANLVNQYNSASSKSSTKSTDSKENISTAENTEESIEDKKEEE